MTLLHSPRFASWARGHLLCSLPESEGRFALTFDDGPGAAITPHILDVLRRFEARATFFTLAGNVRREPALVRRMAEEGHEVAAHGELHWPLPFLLPSGIRREVQRSVAAVVEAGVTAPRFYRPPFGFMMPGQAAFVRSLGVEPVLGDIYPEDALNPGTELIVSRVLERLRAGSIVILHDGSPINRGSRAQTLDALTPILRGANALGLKATTVDELVQGRIPRWGLFPSRSTPGHQEPGRPA